ncbi:MAG: hypothetical protein AAGI68_12680 [Planctomycetota bacterium]
MSLTPLVAPPAVAQSLPPDSAYVVVDEDGHLSLDGQRVRLWGAIGNFPGPAESFDGDIYFGQRMTVQRLKQMGFNMVRFWHYDRYGDYTKGDGSRRDRIDFFFAECKRNGIMIWPAGLGGGAATLYEDQLEEAADMIDEPATRDEWIAATRSMMITNWRSPDVPAMRPPYALAGVWDPRMERWTAQQMRKAAQHLNQHTGLTYADDPVNVVWELTNEQWWIRNMIGGKWQNLPDIFKRSLMARWHAYLEEKYQTDEGLRSAWGFLLASESIQDGTVLLAPLGRAGRPASFNDTNPEALAAFDGIEQPVGRDDFTPQRAADVLEFFTQTLLSHKQKLAGDFKTWGKSCRLSPLLYDTGIGESIQAQFLHQHADAVSHCAYMEGYSPDSDPSDPQHPFYSVLDQYPRISNDVPWLEHNRTPGKPFLCYETQMGNPGKYRAEFPLRLTALAAIQDWDAVAFHYWTIGKYRFSEPETLEGPNSHPGGGAHQYDFTFDEVAFAIRRIAGEIFKHGYADPAPTPTTFTFGRKALYHPDSMSYGRSYGPDMLQDMLYTSYRHGMRLVIDPSVEGDTVEGPKVRADSYLVPSVIQPTDQITFDTTQRQLTIDTPQAMAYVGFFASHRSDTLRFKHGVEVSGIEFNNPPDTPYPITDEERYFAFGLVSTDGQPLGQAKTATLSLVGTSSNTGLDLSGEKPDYGTTPVLVTRVGATLRCDAINGMRYVMHDYHMNELASGKIESGVLTVPSALPVFCIDLSRP